MKKKVLLSSILTIALCACLIAGSTYALFTDSSSFDIEVTAGDVDITASLDDLKLWSVTPDDAGDVEDENGGLYRYEDQTAKDKFLNTGTAKFENNVLTIERITPGDKVSFDITGANDSDVSILMRYVIKLAPNTTEELAKGMVLTADGRNYTGVTSYTSVWVPVAVNDDMVPVTVELGLPVYAGDEYQEKGVEYVVTVEAVQGNAAVSYDQPIVEVINAVSDAAELADAIANPFLDTIVFDSAVNAEITDDIVNKTFWANGNALTLTFKGTLDNVVIDGAVATAAGTSIDVNDATGKISIANSSFISAPGSHNGAAIDMGTNVELVVDNCIFAGNNAGDYAISNTGATSSIKITNSTFTGFKSWAILVNNTVYGDLIVDNCTFETPDGVLKTLLSGGTGVTGDFTFTNNTMIGCKGHDANPDKLLVSGSGTNPVSCTGIKTVTGNTLDGQAWTQQ